MDDFGLLYSWFHDAPPAAKVAIGIVIAATVIVRAEAPLRRFVKSTDTDADDRALDVAVAGARAILGLAMAFRYVPRFTVGKPNESGEGTPGETSGARRLTGRERDG